MSTTSKKIDVILPVRNGAKYIEGAIISVLSDASAISKIIVIDDGSTDETLDIIRRLNASIEISIVSQGPLGLIRALNRGLEEATAEFVARMDADDISLKGRLPTQIDFLINHPNVAVIGTQAEHIDDNGRLLGTKTNFPLDSAEIRRQLLEGKCVVCHPTVLARREALLHCGGYHEAFKHAEDYDLWLRLTDQYNVANLPDVFLQYRRHDGQISNGLNVQQSLSRDFALWCARQRRDHRVDPSATLIESPKPSQLRDLSDDKFHTLADLALAYEAINKNSEGYLELIPDRAFRAIRTLARKRYLGETRRSRYRLLKWSAKTALHRRKFVEVVMTVVVLSICRLADSKHFQLFRRNARTPAAQFRTLRSHS